MKRLPQGPDLTPTILFNPDLQEDFLFPYDSAGKKEIYLLKANSVATFPAYIAHHIAHVLADILVQRKGIRTNYQQEKDNYLKQIYHVNE